jgi:hypothetical protein
MEAAKKIHAKRTGRGGVLVWKSETLPPRSVVRVFMQSAQDVVRVNF